MLRSHAAAILIAFLSSGCTTLTSELQGISYPADTAILIGDAAYQINTFKCAEIRGISEKGALDCYDAEGNQTAAIPPVSEWRRNLVKDSWGGWASPEHQAALFYMFHEGGLEASAEQIVGLAMQASTTISATENFIDSLERSEEIGAEGAQMKMQGVQEYMTGGMPAWQEHQRQRVQWHLQNAEYFRRQ